MSNFTPELEALSSEFVVLEDIYDWPTKKKLNLQMSERFQEFEPSTAERMYKCANWLEFVVPEEGRKRLINARFCKHRLCPVCGWRRSLRWYSRLSQILEHPEMQGYEYLFLTLTVKNVKARELRNTLKLLLSGWKRMSDKDRNFKAAIAGWFRTIEITRNETMNEYHPHIHALLAVEPSYFRSTYIEHSEWVEMWRRASELAYNPAVHIRKVRERGGMIAEVTKYVIKPMDLDSAYTSTIQSLNDSLCRIRAVALGGRMKNVDGLIFDFDDVDDDLIGENYSDALDAKIERVEAYRYATPQGSYVKVGELSGKTRN